MIIDRYLLAQLQAAITPGKVVVLYGPRQVGKTTLVTELLLNSELKAQLINADELRYREALASQNRQVLGDLLAETELLIIDEAQRVENIGLNLKILVDQFPEASFIATGSASFDLANKVSEPLTGRSLTYYMYPVSYGEIQQTYGPFEARDQLDRWLIWGSYPEILIEERTQRREQLLGELVGSYLYRDLLELDGLRKPEKIVDLLRLLAFQIGHEVSLAELATNLAINRETVARYLDLLEKVFVIFRVRGFSRNLRKEVTKNARYYFFDNGVRNALIQNFNPLPLRSDIGQLWENYLVMERRKANAALNRSANIFFWRTYDQKEIDYLEERSGQLFGYKFKRKGEMRKATRREFIQAYPEAELQTISLDNFEEFLHI
ncbi:MAG: ATP-binding protein [Anaerolineales bacterium]|nr:ATP-binding protein [Anaerolineales bacterium]